MKRAYGWLSQLPDHRDLQYVSAGAPMPAAVAPLTANIPAYDQGQLGSCTGNGCARLFEHRLHAEGRALLIPSRLFIYYNERALEGTINSDSGAQVRDGLKVLAKFGAPPETDWPYNIGKFKLKPPAQAYADALKDQALQYHAVKLALADIKQALADGNPVVGGFTVYESFESARVAQTGLMPLPGAKEAVLGGHCVLWDGYDDASQTFWCANSWGQAWGCAPAAGKARGWFKMPYANLKNCSDFWVLLKVA
jgi:C1A family cysteine protease